MGVPVHVADRFAVPLSRHLVVVSANRWNPDRQGCGRHALVEPEDELQERLVAALLPRAVSAGTGG